MMHAMSHRTPERNSTSASYRMADALVQSATGSDLLGFIAARRDNEAPRSWQAIADDLSAITDHAIRVSWMTVRRWADQPGEVAS
jgi:hypothetical protein